MRLFLTVGHNARSNSQVDWLISATVLCRRLSGKDRDEKLLARQWQDPEMTGINYTLITPLVMRFDINGTRIVSSPSYVTLMEGA